MAKTLHLLLVTSHNLGTPWVDLNLHINSSKQFIGLVGPSWPGHMTSYLHHDKWMIRQVAIALCALCPLSFSLLFCVWVSIFISSFLSHSFFSPCFLFFSYLLFSSFSTLPCPFMIFISSLLLSSLLSFRCFLLLSCSSFLDLFQFSFFPYLSLSLIILSSYFSFFLLFSPELTLLPYRPVVVRWEYCLTLYFS